ncbi:Protein HypA [Propionispora sp. 2/2-37]|uniref:insulinase family protein n=1 Tax=Propionispora sp. 2/2-37 TaxID=1677858 RepID=UPI0006BB643E|nr:insulinase family protein [Propionispora sp. 2/2-37]CUH97293.1 Protein HypA [Propionispora sp. 2/2-37]
MQWKIGKVYNGFRLEEQTEVPDIQSAAKIFYHEKSGARLLYLENEDDNKVFSVTFRTPPADSTGVAHIVEHSVLCGSRQFPLKEPFVELVKGSLNTYLNAMTFPDKTMYPVASRNQKDFRNLMNVYLDAVFYPNIYKSPETLMQEGWHYELEDKDGEIIYKGVVYNEMKGVFSSPDAILDGKVMATLFPDTAYGFESGGDPDVIPELTQEKFLAFHRQYYHPSNAYIFLYGDMDILDQLQFLHEEYLSHFDKITVASDIALQKPFASEVEKVFPYPVGPDESTEDKTYLSMNFVVGKTTDAELALAFEILTYILLETSAAPLKKVLVAAGIGKDVSGSFERSLLQPTMGITVSGTNESEKERFRQIVEQELKRLVAEGIDKKLIESAISIFEFTYREANFGSRPKGLIYNIKCMESWLYDKNPLIHFQYTDLLNKIKDALHSKYFEQMIQTYLLQNKHQALIVLRPEPGLAAERDRLLREELAQYKASLSPDEIDVLIKQTGKLKQLQQATDSAEALATIPLLAIKDIEAKSEELPLVQKSEQGVPVLFHPLPTNGISYVNLYFDVHSVPQTHLPYVYLLTELLGKVSTAQYDYTDLASEINLQTGGITYRAAAYSDQHNEAAFSPKLIIKGKSLVKKLPQMFSLLAQIATASKFDDQKRMEELIKEIKAKWDNNLFRRGQEIVASRVLAYFSSSAQFNEAGMLSFYNFITDLERNFSHKAAEIAENLEFVIKQLCNKHNLLVSVTAQEKDYPAFQQAFGEFYSCLAAEKPRREAFTFTLNKQNEGIMTAGKVQYVAKAANFRQLGYDYKGSFKVLETILRYDYLWTRVRVQGGAYGGFASFERNGNMVFGSYRDPNLRETVKVYDETAQYLQSFCADDREMTKYIIGTISRVDTPLHVSQKGEQATIYYLRKISQTDIQKERDEILAVSAQDICNLAEVIDKAMQANYLCVLGSEQKIRSEEELFLNLVQVGQ